MSRAIKASLLFFAVVVCASALIIAQRLRERAPVPAPRELFAIVNQQLVAFRASDFRGAYQQAAAGFQQQFTLAEFERMVRRDYPAITRAQRVEFGLVKIEDRSALVQVFVTAGNGATRSFLYSLINENAAWKIAGVEELGGDPRSWTLVGTHA